MALIGAAIRAIVWPLVKLAPLAVFEAAAVGVATGTIPPEITEEELDADTDVSVVRGGAVACKQPGCVHHAGCLRYSLGKVVDGVVATAGLVVDVSVGCVVVGAVGRLEMKVWVSVGEVGVGVVVVLSVGVGTGTGVVLVVAVAGTGVVLVVSVMGTVVRVLGAAVVEGVSVVVGAGAGGGVSFG